MTTRTGRHPVSSPRTNGKGWGRWVPLRRKRARQRACDDTNRGSVSPGRYADLIVLSEDLFGLEPTAILETRVLTTIVGDEVQFRTA